VGCDKTTPSLLMAAASTNIPSIVVSAGPMPNGWFQGERAGSGPHLWKTSEAVRAARLTQNESLEAAQSRCRSSGTSNTMGTASPAFPSVAVAGGPMLAGWFQGERVGSGAHLWKFSEAVRAGRLTQHECLEAEQSMCRSSGTCNTMGTASTMASMAEALGMALSGNAAIPAVDSRRRVMAQMTGRRIVQMVKDDLKPSDIL